MNIARVLGDKFMKAQDVGLSAEPFISQAVQLGDGFDAIAVIARSVVGGLACLCAT